MTFYINGALANRTAHSGTIRTQPTPVSITIGQDLPTDVYSDDPFSPHYLNDGGYLIGYIDDLRIYKSILTASQVTSIYNMRNLRKMKLNVTGKDKEGVFAEIEKFLAESGLTIANKDMSRPWGGFFVIDEQQAPHFGKLFFPEVELSSLKISGKLSPKILVVQPNKRLSWQYHHRRAEIWRAISGKVAVVTSMTDEEGEKTELKVGDSIRLTQGQRHRLVGLNEWGVIAEIWQHTVAAQPSDEEDIIRLQDDFGR